MNRRQLLARFLGGSIALAARQIWWLIVGKPKPKYASSNYYEPPPEILAAFPDHATVVWRQIRAMQEAGVVAWVPDVRKEYLPPGKSLPNAHP